MNFSPALSRAWHLPDARRLFLTRMLRLFSYGFISIIMVLYLKELGFSEARIGLLLTATLMGDTVISLWITTSADRIGRKTMLMAGAALMIFAGVLFGVTSSFVLLLLAATVGVVSPSGNEVGPFLPIEQASLSHVIDDRDRTSVFAWYTLTGSFAGAMGALVGGVATKLLALHMPLITAYRVVVIGYAFVGAIMVVVFAGVSRAIEVSTQADKDNMPSFQKVRFGLTHSSSVVYKLSGLFAIDAFGGGFVIQSIAAYWFSRRFGVDLAALGGIFFGANVLAGISALLAARIASRFGLINTMVFTHLPSNVLLILVPLMPNAQLAIIMLLLRFSISQMDVPTRQSYTMAVVRPEERSAAAGITGVARTTGASISPVIAGPLLASPALMGMPFILGGVLKIVYDLMLYRSFRTLRPPEEQ